MVAEPPQPKVKLRMSARSPESNPKITLRFGQKVGGTAGVSIDSEALKRQQDLVKAGANGQAAPVGDGTPRSGAPNPLGGSPAASTSNRIPPLHTLSQDRTRSTSVERPTSSTDGVKSEVPPGQSPALAAVQLNRDLNRSSESTHTPNPAISMMPPPPSITPRLASNSPHPPAGVINSHSWNSHPLAVSFESKWRQPGKGEYLHLVYYSQD